jgi:hypothetical protein
MTPGNYDEFLDKSLDTLDLFGVGITLQFVLCHSADFFEKEKYDALEECFFNMMRPSLLHRYSVEEAYSNFTKIMRNDKDSISAYEMDDLLKKMDKKTRNELVMEQEELLEKKK